MYVRTAGCMHRVNSTSIYKRLQLHRVEGIVVCGFSGAPLTDPVHGEDSDAWIVLSRVLVNSKKDTFQLGLCEVFIEVVRITLNVYPHANEKAQLRANQVLADALNRSEIMVNDPSC